MIRQLCLLVLLAAPLDLFAQPVPDTTDPWLYYPLGTGDAWEYEQFPFGSYRYLRREVLGDTTLSGNTYAVVRWATKQDSEAEWSELYRLFERFDSTTTNVMTWTPGGEHVGLCNLGAPFDSWIDCFDWNGPDGGPEDTQVWGDYGGTVTIRGSAVPVLARKQFYTPPADPATQAMYAAPLGWVGDEPAFCGWCRIDLLYAIVSGVEYGSPVVPNGSQPANPAANRLAVSPNPARGDIVFHLTIRDGGAVRVEVFDALGRRSALVHDASLTPGVHSFPLLTSHWAPGAYVIRATGSGWSAASNFVVR